MSINKRQFDLLQAMGITVWQRRGLPGQNSLSAESSETVQNTEQANDSINAVTPQSSSSPEQDTAQQTLHNKNIALDLKTLLKHQLFKDIISSIGASSADLSIAHNQIDLGIINWQFTANKNIEFKHNCLKTPDLTTLANSPELKKSLWQSIGPLSSS
ncbi:DNA polymerase III subunit psi [Colwellia sp. BRX10-3]|uniref:DNA polymerase III subunit psi n=1 Tax=Colwellia sp. BRX10-3 TaxID=2759844 RepID=UPI0015F48A52|nr:DNA polymerase III subunit psi [Colwellia sp. BRX10-3]MBA6391716.1 DNA polymerase III subunit psi [Colwellia sp. BRX10-3]